MKAWNKHTCHQDQRLSKYSPEVPHPFSVDIPCSFFKGVQMTQNTFRGGMHAAASPLTIKSGDSYNAVPYGTTKYEFHSTLSDKNVL